MKKKKLPEKVRTCIYIIYCPILRLVAGGEYEELALYKVLSPSHLILGPSQPCQRQKLHIYTIEM